MRSPDRAKKGDLYYGLLDSRMLNRNSIVQQISPCFLQDLQSEWKKEQMQKSYKGVKSETYCEVVITAAARRGVLGYKVKLRLGWWQMVPMGL